MNDTQAVDTDTIREMVLCAQEAIAEILAPLVDTNDADSFTDVGSELQAQVENIAMIAEMSGLKGLNAACTEFGAKLVAIPFTDSRATQLVGGHVEGWILDVISYLDDWQSPENAARLLRYIDDENGVNTVSNLLLQDIDLLRSSESTGTSFPEEAEVQGDTVVIDVDNNELNDGSDVLVFPTELDDGNDDVLSFPVENDEDNIEALAFPDEEDDTVVSLPSSDGGMLEDDLLEDGALDIDIDDIDSMFAEDADIDLDGPEGIMALLCQELRELQPKISGLTNQLIISEGTEAIEVASDFEDIIGRIHLTSSELGLAGLVQVCEFVLKNINLALTLETESRFKVQPVFEGWPQVMIDHLESPHNDELCLAVVDYLEKDAWPEPLKYSEIRELIDGLAKQLELTGDYEVEERSKEATIEDVSLKISEDTNQELSDAFFAESPGHAEELTMNIASIVDGKGVLEHTKAAQRISHTLKGSANLIGVKGIANLAHHLEDIFEYLTKQAIAPPQPLAYTMQEAADTIEVMIESLQGMSPAPADAQRILQDVLNWANRIDKGNIKRETDIITDIIVEQSAHVAHPENYPDEAGEEQPALSTPQAQTELLRVPRDTIDEIFNLIGETSIAIGQVQEQLKRMHERGDEMRKQEKALQTRRFELENIVNVRGMAAQQQRKLAVAGEESFDSLEMDQYDEFYGATHSFIEAASDTRESSRDITAHIMELEGLFLQQQRLNRTLQNLVMTTRMVPVKTIVARLQRAVRQATRATGKKAELKVIGESLLMDGDVLGQLADPLMHLLRNAIDHGIESPEDRFDSGKPESGLITLRFYQEGNSIRVNCSDDGAGLDYERIRGIAMERNLINEQEETTNQALARIILSSGFSTRAKATHISGRGVGMDVVHTAVLKLKGSLDISDNQPTGTNFNLRLPITLLTSHSILVQVGDSRYAIPTSMLDQILPPGTGKLGTLGGDMTFQLNKEVYPAKSLAELLGLQVSAPTSRTSGDTVLLVRFGSETYAVTVEYVVSNYDLVVKNMGQYVNNVPGIAGVALLGDGGVVPVLDLVELLDSQKTGRRQSVRSARNDVATKTQAARVLIVDDSLSVRKSLSQLVQDAGYEPIVARDGIEALEIMQKTMPDLILTDLEMPRMTGLELTTHVRSNLDNSQLPIVMITSRTMAKHREQAKKAGVDEYVTKPFSEDDLVAKIGAAING